jgi:hypothetical protein
MYIEHRKPRAAPAAREYICIVAIASRVSPDRRRPIASRPPKYPIDFLTALLYTHSAGYEPARRMIDMFRVQNGPSAAGGVRIITTTAEYL